MLTAALLLVGGLLTAACAFTAGSALFRFLDMAADHIASHQRRGDPVTPEEHPDRLCTATDHELAEARTTADETTRAVKRLVVERDYAIAEAAELATMLEDVRAEARGARSDYEELKGFNADLADERDRYKAVINAAKSWREWIAASPVRTQDAAWVESALMDAVDALCGDCPDGCPVCELWDASSEETA